MPGADSEAARRAQYMRPSRPPAASAWRLLDSRLDLLGVRRDAVLDRVQAVVRQRRVAVGIDRVGPQHALAVRRGEQRLDDVGAIVALGAGALDRVEVVKQLFATKDRESVLGTYSIDPNGDTTLTDYGLYTIEDGVPTYSKKIEAAVE